MYSANMSELSEKIQFMEAAYSIENVMRMLVNHLAPVVQRLDNVIHRIKRYRVDKC